jgi:threonine/homoserine/homoserine lactone efflux protein
MLFVLSAILFFTAIGYAAIGSHSGYVIMQKVVVLISLGWFVILAYSVAVVSKWIPSKRQRVIEAQAEWYDRKLRKSRG